MLSSIKQSLKVGARASPLSKAQYQEILFLMREINPHLTFEPLWITTSGDLDQKTSLRSLDKTDFFTKEIDNALLTGECRLAIHSAKDLPSPLPPGLVLAALTKGLDPSDSLVLRPGMTLASLPAQSKIATSSERRESMIKLLKGDLSFVDIRGTIEQRLKKLDNGEVDGVVVAEAALIRLGLTHLNRVKLKGETTPFQGQLAIIVRADDTELLSLFSKIDSR